MIFARVANYGAAHTNKRTLTNAFHGPGIALRFIYLTINCADIPLETNLAF